jgi:hypothetical protein
LSAIRQFSGHRRLFFSYWPLLPDKKCVQGTTLVIFFAYFPTFATDKFQRSWNYHPTSVGINMPPTAGPLNEVQELVWALVDDQATEEQVQRLEELLLENQEARRIYITCMQMHADLHFLLGGKKFELPEALKEAMEAKKSQKQSTSDSQSPGRTAPLPLVDLPISPAAFPNSMA